MSVESQTSPVVSTPAAVATTDPHRSKVDPNDPRLKVGRARGRRLKRGPVLGLTFTLLGVTMIALVFALSPAKETKKAEDTPKPPEGQGLFTVPDTIRNAPDNNTPVGPVQQAGLTVGPDLTAQKGNGAQAGTNPQGGTPAYQGAYSKQQLKEQRLEAFWKARTSGVFANMEGFDEKQANGQAQQGGGGIDPNLLAAGMMQQGQPGAQGAPKIPGVGGAQADADQNLQERKNSFVDGAGAKNKAYLTELVEKPVSPYEVKAGTVIPTTLITGINSDLPGQIVGQVTENIYDWVTGNYLLIPQGSRVIASYDSMVAWGQERVLVCWNRLIRPDGSSIGLQCMPGVDRAGYAGFADDVDNHWWRIISGVMLGSLIGATAQATQGSVKGFNPTLPQLFAAGAAGEISSAAQQITRRNINIQPTLTIRPGFAVNVLVSKDMVFPGPYRTR